MIDTGAFDLEAIVSLLDEPLHLMDVGCRDGVVPRWRTLGPNTSVVAFDPDAAECARLAQEWTGPMPARFEPTALGAHRGTATLHVTADPACSSFFPPEPGIWERYPVLTTLRPVSVVTVDVVDLDTWIAGAGADQPDVLKLDVQGAELDVFRGAVKTLKGVRALDVEVSFAPMYTGQALFSQVDDFMRMHGFALWRLDQLVHYKPDGYPTVESSDSGYYYDSIPRLVSSGAGQLFWGQARYVHRRCLEPRIWQETLRDTAAFAALALLDLFAAGMAVLLAEAPPEVAEQLRAAGSETLSERVQGLPRRSRRWLRRRI